MKSIFDFDVPGRLRNLLEDFEVVATVRHVALVERGEREALRKDVRAALVASTLDLNSLDYARRRYCSDNMPEQEDEVDAYVGAYKSAKKYVVDMLGKIKTDGRPEPSAGVFTSSLVLERLPASFFSAHFLYRLGYRFEGHAVSRLILEQLAWAYAAHSLHDVDKIEKIQATQAISLLKQQFSVVGRMYGFLSKKTHIGFDSHLEFLSIEKGRNVVWHAKPCYPEFALIILTLADLFGVIWEMSQFDYIQSHETVELREGKVCVRDDRPFLTRIDESLSVVKERAAKANSSPDPVASRQSA